MAEIPPLNVKVNIDASGVSTGVAKASAGLDQISTKAKTTQSRMASLGMTLKTLAGGLIATGGVIALTNALRGMRDEAIATEVETMRLNNALTNLGVTASQDQDALAGYAGSFEKLGFGGSEALNALGTLVQATGSVDQAQRLMSISADYARNRHVSLAEAANVMAKATMGNMKAFKAYGIELDASLPKNKAIAKAFDQLNERIGGSATKYLDTFAGRMAVLREQFEAFIENAITPVLPYLTKFLGVLVGVAQWIQKNGDALKVYGGLILVVTAYLKGLAAIQAIIAATNPLVWIAIGVAALSVAFVKLWNTFEGFRKAMATALAVIVAAIGYIVGGIAKALELMSKLPKMGFLKGAADNASKIAENLGKAAGSIDKMSSKKLTAPKIPSMPDFVKPGDKTGIKGNTVNTSGGAGSKETVQYVTVYASNTNDIAKKLAKTAKNGQPIGNK